MTTIFIVIHIIACIILILMVLMQSGEAADLAGAFGGGGSKTAFGPRGATTFIHRVTTIAAIVFMLTSLTLAILYTRSEKPIINQETIKQEATVPQENNKKKQEKTSPVEESKEEKKAENSSEQKP